MTRKKNTNCWERTVLFESVVLVLCFSLMHVDFAFGREVHSNEVTINVVSGETVDLFVSQSGPIFVQAGGELNIYGGVSILGGVAIISPEGGADPAVVTIFGSEFIISDLAQTHTDLTSLCPRQIVPESGWAGYISGLFGDLNEDEDSDFNILFASDTPVFLAPPEGCGTQIIPVTIDIKPGSDPNPINPGSNGLVPVAIFGADDFDVATVDVETITLAGREVATRGKAEKLMSRFEDVDGDGKMDLMLQVDTQVDVETPEEEEDLLWKTGPVWLYGKTLDGKDIEGSDEIVVVPPEE